MPEIYKGIPAVFERKDGKFEIKVLVTAGMLTPAQMKRIGEVAEKNGACMHLTTQTIYNLFQRWLPVAVFSRMPVQESQAPQN